MGQTTETTMGRAKKKKSLYSSRWSFRDTHADQPTQPRHPDKNRENNRSLRPFHLNTHRHILPKKFLCASSVRRLAATGANGCVGTETLHGTGKKGRNKKSPQLLVGDERSFLVDPFPHRLP